jgi:hypothetical protein
MRPPICAFCHLDFRHSDTEGGLVHFALTVEEREFNKRFDEKGYTGHPKGLDWFCGEHIEKARSLAHLTLGAALAEMRKGTP